jgi:2-polyprenyl-3-methyl-5-hydroxy-6-metoxy-1,4-benzoquinol methylase
MESEHAARIAKMLGEALDYLILRALAHRRNSATEEELDKRAHRVFAQSLEEQGVSKVRKFINRFEGQLPLNPHLRYLDLGCGSGEVTIAFSKLGAKQITGVDFLPRSIQQAQALAQQIGVGEQVRFICQDLHTWTPEIKYDVLLSLSAFEHIQNPKRLLEKMADFITRNGIAVLAFGPLFHSPFGDHMEGFFRFQIPWRGALFSEKAMIRVRLQCFRPTDPANCYQEIRGGLNLIRYSDFLNNVRDTGWEFRHLMVDTFLDRLPLLRFASDIVVRVPTVRDYCVQYVYAVLHRPSRGSVSK